MDHVEEEVVEVHGDVVAALGDPWKVRDDEVAVDHDEVVAEVCDGEVKAQNGVEVAGHDGGVAVVHDDEAEEVRGVVAWECDIIF